MHTGTLTEVESELPMEESEKNKELPLESIASLAIETSHQDV